MSDGHPEEEAPDGGEAGGKVGGAEEGPGMSEARQAVCEWLGRVCRETPPASVVASNVGLSETADGYAAYLIGADRYDESSSDWACEESFTPAERYLPLSGAGFESWEDVRSTVAIAVRDFLASEAGRGSWLASAEAVTVGFDDGDLERVH